MFSGGAIFLHTSHLSRNGASRGRRGQRRLCLLGDPLLGHLGHGRRLARGKRYRVDRNFGGSSLGVVNLASHCAIFACTRHANRSCTIPRSTGSVVEDGHVGERSEQQRQRQLQRQRLERRVLHLHLQNNATARAWEINSDHQPAAAWSATAARPERLSDVHDVCCSIFSTPARQMQREHVRFPAVCGSCFDLTCDDDQIAALVRFLKSEMT